MTSGTWTVNGLVDFQPYGCGVLFGTPGIANFNEQVEGMNLYIKETTRTPSSALAGGFPITQ